MAKYKRVLIKLSGEALGDHGRLFDFEQIDRVADVIRQLHETGAEIAIVIGAGNIWRGRQGPAAKMTAVNADHMAARARRSTPSRCRTPWNVRALRAA